MGFEFMDGAGNMAGWGMGGMAFGGLMMVLWFGLIIALIVFVVRWMTGSSQKDANQSSIEILQERYARGEIDSAELQERSVQLKKTV